MARWQTPLVIVLLVLCGLYGSYRAVHLAITSDEVGLLDSASQSSYAKLLLASDKDSNLHFLATLLAKPCLELLPLNEITAARVPSLFGLVLFLWGVWRIGLVFPTATTRVLITVALLSNAFLLDFFSLARGYGLAAGFTMLSLSFLMTAVSQSAPRQAAPALWMAAMAVLSHPGFLYFFVAILVVTAWLAWRERLWIHGLISTGMLALFFWCRLTQGGARKVLVYHVRHYGDDTNGVTGSFIHETISTVLQAGFYDWHVAGRRADLLSASLIFVVILTVCWAYYKSVGVVRAVSAVGVITAACCIAAKFVFSAKYPVGRLALYFIPLTILMFGTMATWFKQRWLRAALWGLILAFTACGAQGLNLNHTQAWRECADIPAVLLALQEIHRQTGQDVTLAISGSKWSIWHYAEHLLGLQPLLGPSKSDMPYLRNYDWLTVYEWRVLQPRLDLPPDNPLLPGTTHVLLNLLDPNDRGLLTTPLLGGLTQLHFYSASNTRLDALTRPRYQGAVTFLDGRKYVGEFKHGLANGQGICTWPDGKKYVGEYKDDMANGRGTCTWPDGQKYVGEYKNGQPNGQGTATWPDGEKYIGVYQDGQLNGRGTYLWADGRKYEGEFHDGQMDGTGKMTYPDGRVEDGLWKQGQLAGSALH